MRSRRGEAATRASLLSPGVDRRRGDGEGDGDGDGNRDGVRDGPCCPWLEPRATSHEPRGPLQACLPLGGPVGLSVHPFRQQEDSRGHKIFWRRGWRSTLFIGILPAKRPSERGTWARGQSTTISFVATDKKSLKTHATARRRTVDFPWHSFGINAWRIQRLARRRHKRWLQRHGTTRQVQDTRQSRPGRTTRRAPFGSARRRRRCSPGSVQ